MSCGTCRKNKSEGTRRAIKNPASGAVTASTQKRWRDVARRTNTKIVPGKDSAPQLVVPEMSLYDTFAEAEEILAGVNPPDGGEWQATTICLERRGHGMSTRWNGRLIGEARREPPRHTDVHCQLIDQYPDEDSAGRRIGVTEHTITMPIDDDTPFDDAMRKCVKEFNWAYNEGGETQDPDQVTIYKYDDGSVWVETKIVTVYNPTGRR